MNRLHSTGKAELHCLRKRLWKAVDKMQQQACSHSMRIWSKPLVCDFLERLARKFTAEPESKRRHGKRQRLRKLRPADQTEESRMALHEFALAILKLQKLDSLPWIALLDPDGPEALVQKWTTPARARAPAGKTGS